MGLTEKSTCDNTYISITVSVKSVSLSYSKKPALKDVSFDIYSGEVLGLVGPNGAGKSTLLSILATVLKPDSGEVLIFGKKLSFTKDLSDIRAKVGYVPQDIALYPMLTGIDNLKFWGGMYGLPSNSLKRRMIEVLDIVGLADKALDRVDTYSGGMKRRMNIAVSLLHDPDFLIMDEPTVGVDLVSRKFISEAILNLKTRGKTIIYTSHYAEEMQKICDRVAIMNEGSIHRIEPVNKMFSDSLGLERILLEIGGSV